MGKTRHYLLLEHRLMPFPEQERVLCLKNEQVYCRSRIRSVHPHSTTNCLKAERYMVTSLFSDVRIHQDLLEDNDIAFLSTLAPPYRTRTDSLLGGCLISNPYFVRQLPGWKTWSLGWSLSCNQVRLLPLRRNFSSDLA